MKHCLTFLGRILFAVCAGRTLAQADIEGGKMQGRARTILVPEIASGWGSDVSPRSDNGAFGGIFGGSKLTLESESVDSVSQDVDFWHRIVHLRQMRRLLQGASHS